MTPNQLPPLPEPHIGLPWRHNAKDGSIHSSAFTWAQMHAYALAALAQQAQPVYQVRGAFSSDPVNTWRDTTETAFYFHPTNARRILYTTPPASQEQADEIARLKRKISNLEEGLSAYHKLLTDQEQAQQPTPPPPQVPAPVDELIEALEDLMDWQVKNVTVWHNRAYDRAYRALKKHRAALQSPAPQTKGGEA